MRQITLNQNIIAVVDTMLGLGYEGLGFVRTFTAAPETKQFDGTYAINLPEADYDNTKLHKNISAVLYNNLSGGVSPGLG